MPPVGAVQLGAGQDHGAQVTQVGPATGAPPAPSAGRQEGGDDVVAGFEIANPRADLLDDASALVAADDRHRHREVARARMVIGVAEPGCLEGDQDLTLLRPVEIDFLDAPISIDFPQNRRVHLHAGELRKRCRRKQTVRRDIICQNNGLDIDCRAETLRRCCLCLLPPVGTFTRETWSRLGESNP